MVVEKEGRRELVVREVMVVEALLQSTLTTMEPMDIYEIVCSTLEMLALVALEEVAEQEGLVVLVEQGVGNPIAAWEQGEQGAMAAMEVLGDSEEMALME